MTDALIARLARLAGVTVRRTGAIQRYVNAPPDAAEAGRALGVDLVLQGAVQKTGDWLRVTSQLIVVRDRASIWADHTEAVQRDILSIEEAIADKVAAAVAPAAALETWRSQTNGVATNRDAHLSCMEGRFHLHLRTPEGLAAAIAAFDRATALDPGCAAAHGGLAAAHTLIGVVAYDQPSRERASLRRARSAALRACEIDEAVAEAHAALAEVAFRDEWNWTEAEARFTRSIQLDPDSAVARHGFATFLSAMGRSAESTDQFHRAAAIDHSVRLVDTGGRAAASSLAEAQRQCEASGRRPYALAVLGFALGQERRIDEARQILGELADLHAHGAAPAWLVAFPHISIGEINRAFEWLSRGIAERGTLPALVNVEPMLAPLRGEPRFIALIQRLPLSV